MTTTRSLAELTVETRHINQRLGWHTPDDNSWGDLISLLHTEISEMTGAWRKHRLTDATKPYTDPDMIALMPVPPKPEGVSAEWSDCVLRFLSMCDMKGITPYDMDCELEDVADIWLEPEVFGELTTFGDWISWLHHKADSMWLAADYHAPFTLRALVTFARRMRIPMTPSVIRKLAHNATREPRHGGTMKADLPAPPPENWLGDWVSNPGGECSAC